MNRYGKGDLSCSIRLFPFTLPLPGPYRPPPRTRNPEGKEKGSGDLYGNRRSGTCGRDTSSLTRSEEGTAGGYRVGGAGSWSKYPTSKEPSTRKGLDGANSSVDVGGGVGIAREVEESDLQ